MTKIGGKGFGLLEGWHRTLNLLKMGRQPDGTWTPVLIRAWVGYGIKLSLLFLFDPTALVFPDYPEENNCLGYQP